MLEWKVIKCKHRRSDAYAICVTHRLPAEPGARLGVYLGDPEDMYIIAPDIQTATDMLREKVMG